MEIKGIVNCRVPPVSCYNSTDIYYSTYEECKSCIFHQTVLMLGDRTGVSWKKESVHGRDPLQQNSVGHLLRM